MTDKEDKKAIEIMRSIRVYDIYPKSASEETKQALDFAIKAIEVVEKIKRSYANCYKSFLNNLENGFSEETASSAFFQDTSFNINEILCEAYGIEEDRGCWIKEIME